MSQARSAFAPLALAAACFVGATAAEAATVVFYRFENGTAETPAIDKKSVVDSSGNALDASPYGKPVYEAVTNPGSTLALRLDGTNARVSIADNPLFELTHSLTLEAYVKLKKEGCGGGIIVRGDTRYDYDPYYLSVGPSCELAFLIEQDVNGVGSLLVSPGALPLNQWIHVAGTLDDATGMQGLYVNGALVASTVTPYRPFAKLKQANHPLLIFGGNVKNSPDQDYLHGSIDEVRISDVALDPSQFLPPPAAQGD